MIRRPTYQAVRARRRSRDAARAVRLKIAEADARRKRTAARGIWMPGPYLI